MNVPTKTARRILISWQNSQNTCFDDIISGAESIRMMHIPAGGFLMQLGRHDDAPRRWMTISAFYAGKYPVTQSQWRLASQLPPVDHNLDPDPSPFKGDMRPVSDVSWLDAKEFCHRLSRHTGRTYRLPSEVEWEYACRAGTTTQFHFGEAITSDLANYRNKPYLPYTIDQYERLDENTRHLVTAYGVELDGVARNETTPVGYFNVANAFGLCDMHGNVVEWCEDNWPGEHYTELTDGSPWYAPDTLIAKDPGARYLRIRRGGDFGHTPDMCRAGDRHGCNEGWSNDGSGFRVCCDVPLGNVKIIEDQFAVATTKLFET